MIYFDENKQAYNNKETIEKWGKTCIYECDDAIYQDFTCGKYVWENNTLILNPDYNLILLNKAKNEKIQDNDLARDEALNRGVVYKEILFDSDTDQKVNLLAMVSAIDDTDTIEWFGMNNDSLICTKEDLLNIGGLITQLHSFVWNKNAEIKETVNSANSLEELDMLEIDYRE